MKGLDSRVEILRATLRKSTPRPVKCAQSLQTKRPKSGLPGAVLFTSGQMRRPGFWPGLISIYFYFNEFNITKMPFWAEIFLSGKMSRLLDFPISLTVFG